ncbi:MAG: hypothetical protein JHC33_05085 [Ignisphaera sp.]|nr:hypothetical protein [Ignisphaera sp.]
MTINLKPINVYQEFDPYDIDVDNRPLLDIRDNISEITSLLETQGFYSELQADPSQEPPGGFTTFSCACVYSNSLLVPIDISKSPFLLDYSTFPIVLILGYNEDTKTYKCLFFSAGITLTNKFASFVPGSQGRLLRVGPGGELVDQMYYDLAHAGKGYQSLYVGKILGPNSLVFGGNQVSILGNNYYLGKNRDDSSSGIITLQRDNKTSNTVFNAVSINSIGSVYNYAEYVNSYAGTTSGVPIYFAGSKLEFDQSTGSFLATNLESKLNEVHFSTPSINTFNNFTQTYLTAGVNVNSLLDFASTNLIHAASYSNGLVETLQGISTKLLFQERITDTTIPVGISINSIVKYLGNNITSLTNQPENLLPTTDSSGITISDYFNVAGAYIGGAQDNSVLGGSPTSRVFAEVEAVSQANANFITNGINDYSDSFTLIISANSSNSIPANIAMSANGYINLSSVYGTLVNKMPVLDAEVTPKVYVDKAIKAIADSDLTKIPLTGTDVKDPITQVSTPIPVTGKLFIDVSNNSMSPSTVLQFSGINETNIFSNCPIKFLKTAVVGGSLTFTGDYQVINAYNLPFTLESPEVVDGDPEVVTKGFLKSYVDLTTLSGLTTFVTLADDQVIAGRKTLTGLLTSKVTSGDNGIRLLTDAGGALPSDLSVANNGTLTINNNNPTEPVLLLSRSTDSGDIGESVTTKDYVDGLIAGVTAVAVVPFYAIWNHVNAPGFIVTVSSTQYACRFNSSSDGGVTEQANFTGTSGLFTTGADGLTYRGAHPSSSDPEPILIQINAGAGWFQNQGYDQYRVSCHIFKNGVSFATAWQQFDGPKGFSAKPVATVSAIVRLVKGDKLVIGARINFDLTSTNPIDHYLSMARIG